MDTVAIHRRALHDQMIPADVLAITDDQAASSISPLAPPLEGLLFAMVILVAYAKQDDRVQHALAEIDRDMMGRISVRGSHIAPFEAFPLICIDLEDVRFHAGDDTTQAPIYTFQDLYLCFRLW